MLAYDCSSSSDQVAWEGYLELASSAWDLYSRLSHLVCVQMSVNAGWFAVAAWVIGPGEGGAGSEGV